MDALLGVEFKYPSLEMQFRHELHPRVREEVLSLGRWSVSERLPLVVVTEVVRTDAMQVDRYVPYAKRLIQTLRTGGTLSAPEKKLALILHALSEQGLVQWAINKFTWHRCKCAVDMRTRHYLPPQLKRIAARIESQCPHERGDDWEFLIHDITAPHMHLAIRDPVWLAQWNMSRTVPSPEPLI
jgi:hypothetical protein